MWLARENCDGHTGYCLGTRKPRKVGNRWYGDGEGLNRFPADYWEAWGGMRLRPGGGPVQISLAVQCEEVRGE